MTVLLCTGVRRRQWRRISLYIFIFIGISFTVYTINHRQTFTRKTTGQKTTDGLSKHYVPLYSDDSIINAHPYDFTITNRFHCQDVTWSEDPFLLILVKASLGDFFDRQQIRQTWGGTRKVNGKLTTTLFLLGLNENTELNQQIKKESMLYGDIVQENFLDAYHNLTIKNIMGMKWVASFCPNATYVVSADADVMLNTYNLVNRLLDKPRSRYAEGSLRMSSKPVRQPAKDNRKWLTSYELYPEATYPPFFPGSCYVMSGDVASSIYHASMYVRYLPWDDVFIGLVMKRLGLKLHRGRGYEQYVRLNNSNSIASALTRGIAVLIRHQSNGVDANLVKLWKSATILSEQKHRLHTVSVQQVLIIVIIICLVWLAAFMFGAAIMMMV